jgi:predicted small lipoprotein YifL
VSRRRHYCGLACFRRSVSVDIELAVLSYVGSDFRFCDRMQCGGIAGKMQQVDKAVGNLCAGCGSRARWYFPPDKEAAKPPFQMSQVSKMNIKMSTKTSTKTSTRMNIRMMLGQMANPFF